MYNMISWHLEWDLELLQARFKLAVFDLTFIAWRNYFLLDDKRVPILYDSILVPLNAVKNK